MTMLGITHFPLRITQDGEIPSYSKCAIYTQQQPRHQSFIYNHIHPQWIRDDLFSVNLVSETKKLWQNINYDIMLKKISRHLTVVLFLSKVAEIHCGYSVPGN